MKIKTEFMHEHPLRKSLKKKDWKRIQQAIDNQCYSSVSNEELDAAHDVFYDAIAGKEQTHLGVLTLQ